MANGKAASIYQTRGRLSISDSAINDNKADNDESNHYRSRVMAALIAIITGNNVSDNSPNVTAGHGTGSSESDWRQRIFTGTDARLDVVSSIIAGSVLAEAATALDTSAAKRSRRRNLIRQWLIKRIDAEPGSAVGYAHSGANGGPISYAGWADYYPHHGEPSDMGI